MINVDPFIWSEVEYRQQHVREMYRPVKRRRRTRLHLHR